MLVLYSTNIALVFKIFSSASKSKLGGGGEEEAIPIQFNFCSIAQRPICTQQWRNSRRSPRSVFPSSNWKPWDECWSEFRYVAVNMVHWIKVESHHQLLTQPPLMQLATPDEMGSDEEFSAQYAVLVKNKIKNQKHLILCFW